MVTEVAQAQARPELAVLSAVAHGKTDAGLDVVVAAFQASAGVDGDNRKALYADLVLFSAGEAARRALEALMLKNYQYQRIGNDKECEHQQGRRRGSPACAASHRQCLDCILPRRRSRDAPLRNT
jgi:hypothetical protein